MWASAVGGGGCEVAGKRVLLGSGNEEHHWGQKSCLASHLPTLAMERTKRFSSQQLCV